MFGGRKAEERRRDEIRLAQAACSNALEALRAGNVAKARAELAAVPKKVDFADIGWKVELTAAVLDLAAGRRKPATTRLTVICARLDETDLSRDDKGYLRLFALYRAIEASRDGKAPQELRDLVEDFRFDHTLVSPELKVGFPLKKTEEAVPAPPPMARPANAGADDPFEQ
ncbi:hypothetical protein X907_0713 [Glycocaulis alkaliphilus]|uniref:Uncharacterized protein n=1 Tax=Glycocaulis alkaliphilus TaxID=1434191 RepID=A0A3T0E7Q1_9PROT|nr:hypothetical protein [Glycocaulis alkaliphilus]AZU03257.1 hypothetical protein X907_0713 [Glycocaulis alkaliphilus]GGB72206.1 hypothetical protein GCM10007417_10050 [Glycocaulis alkaliphilus]